MRCCTKLISRSLLLNGLGWYQWMGSGRVLGSCVDMIIESNRLRFRPMALKLPVAHGMKPSESGMRRQGMLLMNLFEDILGRSGLWHGHPPVQGYRVPQGAQSLSGIP